MVNRERKELSWLLDPEAINRVAGADTSSCSHRCKSSRANLGKTKVKYLILYDQTIVFKLCMLVFPMVKDCANSEALETIFTMLHQCNVTLM